MQAVLALIMVWYQFDRALEAPKIDEERQCETAWRRRRRSRLSDSVQPSGNL